MAKIRNKEIVAFSVFVLLIIFLFNIKFIINPEDTVLLTGELKKTTALWENLIKNNIESNNEIPLWNPYLFSGFSLVASPITGLFYPLNFIFYFLPYSSAYIILIILSMFLTALFTYLYCREIKLPKFSSLLSSIIFILNPMYVLWTHNPSLINAIVWFPLSLLIIEKIIRTKKITYYFILSLSFAMQVLGGGPQFFLYSILITALYALIRLFSTYKIKKSLKQSSFFIASFILGILLSSITLLPALEFMPLSSRTQGISFEEASVHSLPYPYLITFLIPQFFGTIDDYWAPWKGTSFHELHIYLGIFPLILSILGIIFFWKTKYVKTLSIILLFSLLFAFGKYFPFFYLFYKFVPFFNTVRAPARIMMFFIFSFSIIAGYGYKLISENEKLKNIIKLLTVILGISLIGLVLGLLLKDYIVDFGKDMVSNLYYENIETSRIARSSLSLEDYMLKVEPIFWNIIKGIVIFISLLASIIILLLLWMKKYMGMHIFKFLILAVIITDLIIFNSVFMQTLGTKESSFGSNQAIDYVKEDKDIFRILSLRGFFSEDNVWQNLAYKHDIEKIGGCEGIFLQHYLEYSCLYSGCEVKPTACMILQDVNHPKLVGLLNGKYVIGTKNIENDALISVKEYKNENGNIVNIYENKEFLPRAFVVPKSKLITDKDDIFKELTNPQFSPKKYAILEQEASVQGDRYKEAIIVKKSPNEIIIEAEGPGILVLSEIYYPGWKVFIDNKEKNLLKANYVLRAVELEEGNHQAVFKFRPSSYRIGRLITLTALTLVLASFFIFRRKKHN